VSRVRVTTTAVLVIEADLKEGLTLDEAVADSTKVVREILVSEGADPDDPEILAIGVALSLDVSSSGEEVPS
jgi:hypothetical protein